MYLKKLMTDFFDIALNLRNIIRLSMKPALYQGFSPTHADLFTEMHF